MTDWYTVTARALQPVSIGRTNAKAFLTRTEPVVTGATLRGAFAAWWLRSRTQDQHFRALFDGEVRFGPLLRDDCLLESLSVTECRYHRGQAHARYFDRAFNTGDQPVCVGVPEPLKGRVRSRDGGAASLSITTSTAINPDTGTALDGSLLSRESNAKGSTFTGHIVGDAQLVALLGEKVRLTLGGRSSVQGAVEVSIKASVAPRATATPAVVRSLSPTILVDEAGRPSTDFAAALTQHGLTPQRVFAGRVTTEGSGGWHAASGLPKPTDIALGAGSVAVVDGSQADLDHLVSHGLGIRRAEGFGFLDFVTQPWTPTVAPAAALGGQAGYESSTWQARIREVALNANQLRWLAVQLGEVAEGDHAEAADRLERPGAGTLNAPQRTLVEDVLVSCPQHLRGALARDLREGRV